ncbi:type IX secretion system membrane protein PorP/SprF [Mucilaginibacter robiniae]|uniref:Type IX secretion system membrane protein PorP/SprF n=1 Tax=Mucilaginibacter robiniae TaxID=2728022 RepID=A0A7L5E3X9_9SPHI|nr:type IX secretion system membrane protein PorP/SprF [Mucilaginibacter robiniae]QJD98032.1 type IX secretion system membrane protein PorP/SprF [Mucilaginibacter robiniae]
MKKLLLILTAFIFYLPGLHAQQKPQYTQYVFNNFLLNPAVSGIENYTDVKAGYRSQWTGLNGAPVTSYLTINAPLGSRFIEGDATSMPNVAGGDNPFSRSYNREYMAAEPHHGIGAMVVTDRAGPITTTNLDATYAYHLGISSKLNLAVGVMAGFEHVNLDISQVSLDNPDDPAIYNGHNSQWKPDVGVGLWAYSGNYYVGVSAQQLIKQNLTFGESSAYNQSQLVPHYFVTAGYKVFLSDDVALLPSVLFKYVKPAPTSFDVNLKVAFSDKIWIGGSYRHNDSYAGMAGINISSIINVGYSYDFTSSSLNTVSNGSHEIVIGILLNNRYKVRCPQRSW